MGYTPITLQTPFTIYYAMFFSPPYDLGTVILFYHAEIEAQKLNNPPKVMLIRIQM